MIGHINEMLENLHWGLDRVTRGFTGPEATAREQHKVRRLIGVFVLVMSIVFLGDMIGCGVAVMVGLAAMFLLPLVPQYRAHDEVTK